MPAGVRGEPGVKKIRHYRNADGKLLVDITRSLRASERSRAAPFGQFARPEAASGPPCLPFCQAQPAGISGVYSGHFPGFQGLFFGISSWRPGIRRLSRGIRRFSRRWDQRLFLPPHHPRRRLACFIRAQYFWRRGFMPARPRKLLLSREEASKAERQERCTACAALPLPQSTLSSEPSSTPRLLWPPSRRAPVVPIRVCQHDDANRRNGQETEIGDRAGEG